MNEIQTMPIRNSRSAWDEENIRARAQKSDKKRRLEFSKINLLYKIDLILFGGHCGDGFEMAVKVTLVKKTAF